MLISSKCTTKPGILSTSTSVTLSGMLATEPSTSNANNGGTPCALQPAQLKRLENTGRRQDVMAHASANLFCMHGAQDSRTLATSALNGPPA